jgi:hypothetical protein
MLVEAVGRRDESAVDALEAPTMWDALHSERVENSFLALAFIATSNSLRAETAALAGRLLMFAEERKGAAADEAKLDNYFGECILKYR